MNIEDRIRAALRARASRATPRPDPWKELERRFEFEPEGAPDHAISGHPVRRIITIGVAFAVFVAAGLFVWSAFRTDRDLGPLRAVPSGYSDVPSSGYWIVFPTVPDTTGSGAQSGMRVVALTNLPDGTLTSIGTNQSGTCCPPVKDGQVVVEDQNGSCFGLVGDTRNAPDLTITITVAPDTGQGMRFGPLPTGDGEKPPSQPPSVVAILGDNFESLSGDQVHQTDAGKELVATTSYAWPDPQCGGDPFPLFGGPDCDPGEQQNQLQGDNLRQAMTDVMGAISQARMCEFWAVELPPDVEAQHPWPAFADEWRSWYLDPPKDFASAQQGGNWEEGPLSWHIADQSEGRYVIDVTYNDEVIVTLVVEPLPDFCPHCDPNVVPFWGVVDWTLR